MDWLTRFILGTLAVETIGTIFKTVPVKFHYEHPRVFLFPRAILSFKTCSLRTRLFRWRICGTERLRRPNSATNQRPDSGRKPSLLTGQRPFTSIIQEARSIISIIITVIIVTIIITVIGIITAITTNTTETTTSRKRKMTTKTSMMRSDRLVTADRRIDSRKNRTGPDLTPNSLDLSVGRQIESRRTSKSSRGKRLTPWCR